MVQDIFYTFQNIHYRRTPQGVEVASLDIASPQKVIIPSHILCDQEEVLVAGVGYKAFEDSEVSVVELSEGISYIADEAFLGAEQLTNIVLPSTLRSIGECAFSGCHSLEEVTLPEGIEVVGASAFVNCAALQCFAPLECNKAGYYIEDGVLYQRIAGRQILIQCPCAKEGVLHIVQGTTDIAPNACLGCSDLVSVVFPTSLQQIGEGAFWECISLCEVDLPLGIHSIGDAAFFCCTSLKSVTLPLGISYIGESVFSTCTALTDVVLPQDWVKLPAGLFTDCTQLLSCVLPDTLSRIEMCAFQGCKSLDSIGLPPMLKHIDSQAFAECSAITSITWPIPLAKAHQATIALDAFAQTSIEAITMADGVLRI